MIKYIKKRWNYIQQIIKFCCDIATVITLVITVFVLKEDIISRNSTYMPLIKVELLSSSNVELKWDLNEEVQISEIPKITLKLTNIGNGVANKLKIDFDKNILNEWKKELLEIYPNPQKKYDFLFDERGLTVEYSYLPNDLNKYIEVDVPAQYMKCLREIYRWNTRENRKEITLPIPCFKITYYDVQGRSIKYEYGFETNMDEIVSSTSNIGKESKILSLNLIEK